ncbi:MAG: DUF1302 domain-containing protein [Gammaproteobacteria bacterium]
MGKLYIERVQRCTTAAVMASLGTLLATGAHAVDFQNDAGTFSGSWDTTLSFGQAWRIERRDCDLIALANGGCGRSPNIDDGNLNYDTDKFSSAFKAVSELSLTYKNVGAFVRGSGLYDQDVEDGNTDRTPLNDRAEDIVGSYTRLLDAFAYAKFDLGSMPAELRLGRQVVSWGESTFIQGGINVVNHFDVAALRVPGSELKEAFLPQELALFSLQLSDMWSTQLLYIADWNETIPEPAGSFFSTNDFAAIGGDRVVLGFGGFSDQGVDFRPLGGTLITDFQNVRRLPNREPDDEGQYGVNVKLYLPNFNNGTEFGLYYLNYHSRLPLISGRTGTQAGIGNAVGALTAVAAAAQGLAAGLPFNAAVGVAAATAVARSQQNGGNLSPALAQEYATIGANTSLARGDVAAQAANLGAHEYAKSAGYFTEFPEDIQLIGLSFNTQLQKTGIALQGELTYRMDQPLQFDDVELLFAALTPFEAAARAAQGVPMPATCVAGANATLTRCGQLGGFVINQEVPGWGVHDTWQFQSTATKTFANVLGAAQMVVVLEGAVTHIENLPDKAAGGPNGRGLRYNGPGTSVSGNPELAPRHCPELPAAACAALNLLEPANRFADATSWGYRFAGRFEYPGLIGAWNIVPRFSWQHDVDGTTPGPGGSFVEGRYGLTLGVAANLRATYELDVAWTRFGGADRYNDVNDRDFIAAAVKFSF